MRMPLAWRGPQMSRVCFFQAEGGIRVTSVTGVQTCALPISAISSLATAWKSLVSQARRSSCSSVRSEERRVGKECSYRWSQDHQKEEVCFEVVAGILVHGAGNLLESPQHEQGADRSLGVPEA